MTLGSHGNCAGARDASDRRVIPSLSSLRSPELEIDTGPTPGLAGRDTIARTDRSAVNRLFWRFRRAGRRVRASARDPQQEARDTLRGPRFLVVHPSTPREWQGRMIGRVRRFGRRQPHHAALSLFVSGLSAGNLEAPGSRHRARFTCKSLVDRTGLEPVTSAVQRRRSPN